MAGVNGDIISPWIVMRHLDWSALTHGKMPVHFKRGQFIYSQDRADYCVYIVQKGRVNVSLIDSIGQSQSIYIADEGCMFGERSLFAPGGPITQAQAVSDCSVFSIFHSALTMKIETDSVISSNITQLLAYKTQVMATQIQQLSFCDSLQKIKNILACLIETYGIPVGEGYIIKVRFTHQELGGMASVSRVTVSNILSAMSKAGVISHDLSGTTVMSVEALYNFQMP